MNSTSDNASGATASVVPAVPPVRLAWPKDLSVSRAPRMRIWFAWLAVFYAVWFILNFGFGWWTHARTKWPIALAMALGSYVAGSTPMGGGTVGFPVLVLLFHTPAAAGRNFGLLIQSIGMTSASIFILCRRTPVESRTLRFSVIGAIAGLVVGTFGIAPYISDAAPKLIFACLWLGFGVLTLLKNRELCASRALPTIAVGESALVGILVGVAGGVTTALTGVGIDMMLYAVLVLLYRMDLKAAVPTSVLAMAITSVFGTIVHLGIGDFGRDVFDNWLAAAPVVILGAPLGAFLASRISRVKTSYFVAVLCVLQFVWTTREVVPSRGQWSFIAANLAMATLGFVTLYRAGRARASKLASTGRAP